MPRNSKQLPLLLGALLLTSACHGPLKPGLNALAEGNYSKAEKHARTGLKKDRDDPKLNLLLADSLVGEDRFREALPYARRAFKAPELAGPAGRTLGKVLWELDQTIDAVRTWRTARVADPTTVPDADYVRALERAVKVAEKDADPKAELEFRQELHAIDGDHPEGSEAQRFATREKLAAALVREGSYEDAIKIFEALSEERPTEGSYPFERGRLLARLGEDKRSIAAFSEFVAIGDPDKREQRMQDVATRAETIGAFTVAVYFYEEAIQAMPDKPSTERARIHRRVGGLLLSTGIKDQGEQHIRAYVADMAASTKSPVSAEVYINASTVATSNRHPDLALALLEEAIIKAEPSWRASRQLAELYARRGKTQDVERVLRTYVERAEGKMNPKLTVGEWAASRRNFELARFFLEQAVNEDKDTGPAVWLQLARVYSALGYMDEVRRCLNTYTSKSTNKRQALIEVASIYRAQRMYDEAEKSLVAARKSDPNDLLVVKLLEDLYREWGRPKKIHDAYDAWAKARGNKPGDLQLIGERFFRQQEWDNALPYLIRAAKAGEHDAWLQVADIYNRQRKERDMKEALQKYLDVATNRSRALNAVLQRYRVSNWSYEAIPVLEELITLEPRNLLHYEQLSQLYFQQGRDVEAFELWKRFIALADNPIVALETMARRFQRKQHLDWMLQFLHQVLARETQPDPRIYRLLGDTYADLWTTRRQQRGAQDVIFTQENKAKEYYARYLEEAKPSRGELQTFAEAMRQKRYWNIAAQAYDRLQKDQPLQAHQLLNHGIVLLNLGQAARAEAVFADFYDRRNKSVEAAMAVSDQLFTARRYDATEPYLRSILREADEEAIIRQSFMRLAEIYRNTDRPNELKGLIGQFLDRSQDPSEARRGIRVMLESAGMWAEAAEQFESSAELDPDQGYELGSNLFRAGKRDRADDAFRDYAADNMNPGEAWGRVAQFYESRGEVEKARNAFQNAVNAAPQSEEAIVGLGQYLIRTGRIDEGRAAMERARSKLQHNERGRVYKIEVEALMQAGFLGEARASAREAIGVAYLDRDYFYGVIAPTELRSGDPVRSQRMMDEVMSAGLPLEAVVRLLGDAGYLEEAIGLIDKEIVSGDHLLGGRTLIQHADMYGKLGGLDRLMRSAQPLLEGTSRDVFFPAELGRWLVQEGHAAEGAMLLRQALELGGDARVGATLADIYATLGYHDEAFQILQSDLATLDEVQRTESLRQLGYRYEVLGERGRFRNMLELLARDARFSADALPFLLRHFTEDGDVALVVDTVERMTALPPVDGGIRTDDGALEIAIAALSAGVEELAAGGYEQEALSLLSNAPAELSEREEVLDLRLRMAAFGDEQDAKREFDRALATLGESNDDAGQRLRVAELAMAAGHYRLARDIAAPVLTSADFALSSRSLRVTLRAARAENDLAAIDATIAGFLERTPDRLSARATVHSELSQLGLDRRALLLAEEQAGKVPIYTHVRDAFVASQRFGDAKRIKKWATRLVEVDRQNPNVTLQHTLYQWTLRQDDRLNVPLREILAGTYDKTMFGDTAELMNLYRIGKPYEARERMKAQLERVKFDPAYVEHILATLAQYKLWGEAGRVVAGWITPAEQSVTSQRLIGIANMAMGFDNDGLRALDQAIEAAPDGAHEATQIADALLLLRRYDVALRYADLAVQKRPTRPNGLRVRGLARIGVGDLAGAEDDIAAASTAGIDRGQVLHRAATIALRNNHDEIANKYLDALLVAHGESPEINVRRVFDAFSRADRAADGIKFIEQRRPQIAAGNGVAGTAFVSTLSQLYESAGQPERSFAVYDQGIRRMQYLTPLSEELATYRNNLAYGYSTTDRNIAEGFDLVRRAIAQNASRQASYIDTLGWLHYREGDLKMAESEIRRAIRSSSGAPGELTELYHHLAVLRAAQGYHGQAVWHQIFADSVDSLSD